MIEKYHTHQIMTPKSATGEAVATSQPASQIPSHKASNTSSNVSETNSVMQALAQDSHSPAVLGSKIAETLVSETLIPVHLKQLIHDINNSLMLISIGADRLDSLGREACAHIEHLTQKPPLTNHIAKDTPQPAMLAAAFAESHDITRANITQIRNMLQDASDIMRLMPTDKTAMPSPEEEAAAAAPHALSLPAHSQHLAGRSKSDATALDHHDLLQFFEIQKTHWAAMAPPEATISCQIPSFEGVIIAKPSHLARLLQNLVRNASEAYRSSLVPLALRLHITKDKQHLCFFLSDNGPGIDEDMKQKLFLMEHSSKVTEIVSKERSLPRGVGLASAAQLAAKMGAV